MIAKNGRRFSEKIMLKKFGWTSLHFPVPQGLFAGAAAFAASSAGSCDVEALGQFRYGTQPRLDDGDGWSLTLAVGLERLAHGRHVLGAGAAAAADDARAGIERNARIVGHQLGRTGVVDMTIDIWRDAAIALGDDAGVGSRRGDAEDRRHQLGGADAAIGADRHGLGAQ